MKYPNIEILVSSSKVVEMHWLFPVGVHAQVMEEALLQISCQENMKHTVCEEERDTDLQMSPWCVFPLDTQVLGALYPPEQSKRFTVPIPDKVISQNYWSTGTYQPKIEIIYFFSKKLLKPALGNWPGKIAAGINLPSSSWLLANLVPSVTVFLHSLDLSGRFRSMKYTKRHLWEVCTGGSE